MNSPRDESPSMNLPLELHVALTRLDAYLGATRGAIQDLMRCCFPRPPHGMGTVQYRALEDALHERRSIAQAEPSAAGPELAKRFAITGVGAAVAKAQAASPDGVPLGIGRWSLREDGWALALPDGGSLALGADERSILLHIARSPEHRISQDELNSLLGLSAARREARTESSEIHARVINRLRRRTRALGERLPLRLIRGWGYQLARSNLSNRRRSLPMAGVTRPSEAYGARKSEEVEMRL